MIRDEAIDLIRNSAVSRHTETLLNYLNPSARMVVHDESPTTNGESISSHLGGLPYLPEGTAWPEWEDSGYLKEEIASTEKRIEECIQRDQEPLEKTIERITARLHPETAKGVAEAARHEDPEKARERQERHVTRLRANLAKLHEELLSGPTPLAFLGGISLREAFAAAPPSVLPSEGSLAFFFDATRQVWGFSPAHRGHCRVLYFPEQASLAQVSFPARLATEARFPYRSLSFECEWTLPGYLELEQEGTRLALWKTDEYQDLIARLVSDEAEKEAPIHRLGGYPQEVQQDMRLECQLVTNGLYCGNASGYNDPRAAELAKDASNWRLLAQFDSDEKLGWMWGDVGRVYFWARQQDIQALDFSKSWAILQCG